MNKLVIVLLVSSMLVAACFAVDPAPADGIQSGSETGGADDLDTAQSFFGGGWGYGGGYRRYGGYGGYGGGWGRRRFYGGGGWGWGK